MTGGGATLWDKKGSAPIPATVTLFSVAVVTENAENRVPCGISSGWLSARANVFCFYLLWRALAEPVGCLLIYTYMYFPFGSFMGLLLDWRWGERESSSLQIECVQSGYGMTQGSQGAWTQSTSILRRGKQLKSQQTNQVGTIHLWNRRCTSDTQKDIYGWIELHSGSISSEKPKHWSKIITLRSCIFWKCGTLCSKLATSVHLGKWFLCDYFVW